MGVRSRWTSRGLTPWYTNQILGAKCRRVHGRFPRVSRHKTPKGRLPTTLLLLVVVRHDRRLQSDTPTRKHRLDSLNHSSIHILTLYRTAENGRPHYSHQACRRVVQKFGDGWRRYVPSPDRFPAVPAAVYHEQAIPKTFLLSVNFSVNASFCSLRGVCL